MLRITVGVSPGAAIADRGGVHDDYDTAGVVADSVGDVAEQELLPTCHSRVADNEDVDRLLLGGANDRHRRIIIYDDKRTATLTGELPGIYGKLLAGCDRSGVFGGSVLGDGWALRYDYLHDDQFGVAAIGQRGGPSDGLVRRFGPIGPNHHAPHRGVRLAVRSRVQAGTGFLSHIEPSPRAALRVKITLAPISLSCNKAARLESSQKKPLRLASATLNFCQ